MSELIVQRAEQPEQPSQSSNVLAVISRAASDPNVDMDKLERLLDMQERIMDKEAERAFNTALAEMQLAIPSIAERKVIKGKTRDGADFNSGSYATLEDIVDVIRPIMNEYGFAISFSVKQSAGAITVVGELVHKGGHSKQTEMTLPHETSGSKNAVQAIGSSTSYGKRYVLCAMLNIATRGEDDDGYAAVPFKTLTDIQREQMRVLYGKMNFSNQQKCFASFGEVEDIDRGQFDKVHAAMMAILKQQGKESANT